MDRVSAVDESERELKGPVLRRSRRAFEYREDKTK